MSASVTAADSSEKVDMCLFNFIHKCFLQDKSKLCELLTEFVYQLPCYHQTFVLNIGCNSFLRIFSNFSCVNYHD